MSTAKRKPVNITADRRCSRNVLVVQSGLLFVVVFLKPEG
jgi:hypothetical protein